ncbi:MAG: FlgD immunoglobulin-like domain containing protein [Candidatus Krumholzibacteriia bacterium]
MRGMLGCAGRRIWNPRVLAALAWLLLLASGCGDDPVRPHVPALQGRFTDASGNPVEGAHINLVYEFETTSTPAPMPAPCDLHNLPNPFAVTTTIRFNVGEPAPTSLAILDASGDHVRTVILNSRMPAGTHRVLWDGSNEGEQPVPSGAYVARLEVGGGGSNCVSEITVFRHLFDPHQFAAAALAVTDADGQFQIELSSLPIGEVVPFVSADGETTGQKAVSDSLRVFATAGTALPLRFTSVRIGVGDLSRSISVDLQLPD